jgi:hypothetical protein
MVINMTTLGKHWKMSDQGRKNISDARRGNQNTLGKHWKISKAKLEKWGTRKHTLQELEKMRAYRHTPEEIENIKKSLIGNQRGACPKPSLIGNKYGLGNGYTHMKYIGEEREEYLKDLEGRRTIEYLIWRRAVLKRDGYTCQACGSKENLEAHHLKGWILYPDLRFVVNNGWTLCIDCHNLWHSIFGK